MKGPTFLHFARVLNTNGWMLRHENDAFFVGSRKKLVKIILTDERFFFRSCGEFCMDQLVFARIQNRFCEIKTAVKM